MHYLSPKYWKQGLLQAIDVDGSGYVTIAEINGFSALRPRGPEGWRSVANRLVHLLLTHYLKVYRAGWHIGQWVRHMKLDVHERASRNLAYCRVAGQELVLKHYCDAIDRQLVQIRDTAAHALPLNRAFVQKLLGGGVFYTCDCLLAGVYLVAERRPPEPLVFAKFESRVRAEEDELRRLLESLAMRLTHAQCHQSLDPDGWTQ